MKITLSTEQIVKYILIVVVILKLVTIFSFNDTGWEPDSYQHVNELNTVYSSFPHNLDIGLQVWSKPLYSFTFGLIPLVFGHTSLAVFQAVNALIFALVGWILFKLSKELFKNGKVAILLTILSQISFLTLRSSLTALTEPIFTLLLMLSLWFIHKQRYVFASICLGFGVLGRLEGLLFLGIFLVWYLWSQRDRSDVVGKLQVIFAGIGPTLVWNFLGTLLTGRVFYLFTNGYPANSENIYGTGDLLHFPLSLFLHEGVIVSLFLVSIIVIIQNRKKIQPVISLSIVMFFSYLFVQMILWKFGLLGNAGLIRYFISLIPLLLLISGFGLRGIRSSKFGTRLILVVLIAQVILTSIHFFGIEGTIDAKYLRLESESYRTAGEWVKENVPETVFVGSDRPEVIYYAGRNLEKSMIFPKDDFELNRPGIFVYSRTWGQDAYGISASEFIKKVDLVKVIEGNYIGYLETGFR